METFVVITFIGGVMVGFGSAVAIAAGLLFWFTR